VRYVNSDVTVDFGTLGQNQWCAPPFFLGGGEVHGLESKMLCGGLATSKPAACMATKIGLFGKLCRTNFCIR